MLYPTHHTWPQYAWKQCVTLFGRTQGDTPAVHACIYASHMPHTRLHEPQFKFRIALGHSSFASCLAARQAQNGRIYNLSCWRESDSPAYSRVNQSLYLTKKLRPSALAHTHTVIAAAAAGSVDGHQAISGHRGSRSGR